VPEGYIRVMGIDPGIAFCGVSVLEVEIANPKPRCLALELMRTSKQTLDPKDAVPGVTDDDRRIEMMQKALSSYLTSWQPTVVAMELYRPFGAPNSSGWKTALVYGLISGMVRAHGAWLLSFTPQAMKKKVTGIPAGKKEAVIERVSGIVTGSKSLLDYFPKGQREHLADATGHALLGMDSALKRKLYNFSPNHPDGVSADAPRDAHAVQSC
jgi:Holliday junction resolvasome RuvABC endonuclease subunit